jgi:hypothetical protein
VALLHLFYRFVGLLQILFKLGCVLAEILNTLVLRVTRICTAQYTPETSAETQTASSTSRRLLVYRFIHPSIHPSIDLSLYFIPLFYPSANPHAHDMHFGGIEWFGCCNSGAD